MPTFLRGMDAKLYYGVAAGALTALDEATNVKDVTLNLDAGEADVTTRGNSGWRATIATLKDCSVDFEMLWLPADPAFAAIRDAYLTNGLIELAVLTGGKTVSGSEGIKGSFSISSFSRSEPLEEGVSVSVTAKLSVFDEWVEV